MQESTKKTALTWITTGIFLCCALLVGYLYGNNGENPLTDEDADGYPLYNELGVQIDCDDKNPDRFPANFEIPDDDVDQDCDGIDLPLNPDIDQNEDKKITLYKDFIFRDSVTSESIVNQSRLIKVTGTIKSAELFVKANTTEYGYDTNRKHTVYFYIDSGQQGGHIGVIKENNLVVSGDFFTKESENGLEKYYHLDALPLSTSNGQQTLNVINVLNAQQNHYIGAFVSTGIYGVLDELSIEYTCADSTPDCEISILR